LRYALSLPERTLRALFAGVGGTVQEAAQLALPRFVRRSRLYEASAKNALRIAVELVGGVARAAEVADGAEGAGGIALKKAAGNVVELGSIAAFGFSPLWLLAGAADVLRGSRVYLRALEQELQAAGLLAEGTRFESVDQLVGALEGTTGQTARLIDLPPLELAELRRSLAELRRDATSLPTPAELGALFEGLVRTARLEGRSLLEVSSGVGLAFVTSARHVGREHLMTPYREDWAPLRREGFGAYAARVAGPYREAIAGHFDAERATLTERAPELSRRAAVRGWGWLRARVRRGGG
jgi:hypothetical protein